MNDTILVIKKIFSATPEEVFKAWTDPMKVAEWYGPEGMTTTIHAMDVQEGGSYSLTMEGPDGAHPLKGQFKTIDSPKKLVFTWQWNQSGDEGEETLVTVEFKDIGGKTEMTFTHSGFSEKAERDNHNKGWSSSFNKLDKILN